MKKKKIIESLNERVTSLEQIIRPSGITLTDPSDQNKQVFIGIKSGSYIQDIIIKNQTETETNIITQNI